VEPQYDANKLPKNSKQCVAVIDESIVLNMFVLRNYKLYPYECPLQNISKKTK
jgi:hypothetical protein